MYPKLASCAICFIQTDRNCQLLRIAHLGLIGHRVLAISCHMKVRSWEVRLCTSIFLKQMMAPLCECGIFKIYLSSFNNKILTFPACFYIPIFFSNFNSVWCATIKKFFFWTDGTDRPWRQHRHRSSNSSLDYTTAWTIDRSFKWYSSKYLATLCGISFPEFQQT